jgi:hypothetical protein
MNVTVHIPDDVARRLTAAGGDLSRRALEAFALEEYKSGHLTNPELRRLLGYETRAALDTPSLKSTPSKTWNRNGAT